MSSALRVDELHVDANLVADFLHTLFQHVPHTEFLGQLLDLGRLAFENVE